MLSNQSSEINELSFNAILHLQYILYFPAWRWQHAFYQIENTLTVSLSLSLSYIHRKREIGERERK